MKQNMLNQTISELYNDGKKSKYYRDYYPNDIFKSVKTFMKIFIPKRQPPKLPLLKVLAKFLTEENLK